MPLPCSGPHPSTAVQWLTAAAVQWPPPFRCRAVDPCLVCSPSPNLSLATQSALQRCLECRSNGSALPGTQIISSALPPPPPSRVSMCACVRACVCVCVLLGLLACVRVCLCARSHVRLLFLLCVRVCARACGLCLCVFVCVFACARACGLCLCVRAGVCSPCGFPGLCQVCPAKQRLS